MATTALQRITTVLNSYQQWLTNPDPTTVESVLNECSMRQLINDYNHVKQNKYDLSSNNLLNPASLSKCIPSERHRRDNLLNPKEVYYTQDIKQILLQQLLDQIYLYFHNPLSKDKKNTSITSNRFGTNIDPKQQYAEHKHDVDNKSDDMDPNKGDYNFGQAFFYWEYYQDHDWFITPKYDNLKDELLNNELCKIDKFVWDLEYENAKNKQENDERVRSIRSNGKFVDKYEIAENVEITMDHLLSILFYCNTNELQNKLTWTFRRLSMNETDQEFKDRHSHYYNFAKLLRETVEVFGMVWVYDELRLYHGIDHPLYFETMTAQFHVPTSTTKNRMIAAEFTGLTYVKIFDKLCECYLNNRQ